MKKKNLNEKLERLISKIALEGAKGKGSIKGLTTEDKEALLIALKKARDYGALQDSFRDLYEKYEATAEGKKAKNHEAKRKEKINQVRD